MRILEVSTSRIWGGGESHLANLCSELRRRGHSVSIAGYPGTPFYERLGSSGWPLFPLSERQGAERALASWMVQESVEIVHAHQGKGAETAIAAHYLSGRGKVILTRHTLEPPSRKLLAPGLAALICVSRPVAEVCRQRGVLDELIHVIPNGVDQGYFSPDFLPADRVSLGLSEETIPLVICGRLSKEKGVSWAARALEPLLHQGNYHLLLVGEGEERPRLERRAARAGLGARISLLGWKTDVRPCLALAGMVIVPGANEGFGLSALEAMAMGWPVVAAEGGGLAELIEDEASGLLVSAGDDLGLAAAVYRLAKDVKLRESLGQKARERALEFTLEKMVERTERLMRDICQAGPFGLGD
jgi:L-malate glycosyltransferase